MAYQSLGIGSSLNDGTGDTLRSGGSKINDNSQIQAVYHEKKDDSNIIYYYDPKTNLSEYKI